MRENIDEYIAISNKQFAAENDFVKYQLAGTTTAKSKRISSYHYKPSKRSVAALLQLLHALLQSKRISSYEYKTDKKRVKPEV